MTFIQDILDPLSKYTHQPGDPPLQVRMDITNKCNLLCKMCHYPSVADRPRVDFSPELMRKVVKQVFPHADWVALACQYEAFMSPHINEILEIIAEGPCKRVGIVTNATLWTERRIRLLVENPAIETLSVSIDGGTKETYERIRINGRWEKLVKNLEMFAEIKKASGGARPYLRLNTVLMRSTAKELVELVKLAIRAGAMRIEAIRFLPINPELDEAIDDWEEVMPTLVEAKKLAHDHGIEVFLPIEDPRLDIERDKASEATCNVAEIGQFSQYCEAPWSAVQIQPNGDVHPCGFMGKSFGNIAEQDFEEIWNSRPYLELRRSLVKMKLGEKCRLCNPHGYDNIERKGRINKKEIVVE